MSLNQVVRVANWNLACGARSRYRCAHLDEMIALLKHNHVDIVFLQEVDKNLERSGNRDITQLISEKLGFEGFFASTEYMDGFGNAIVSRYPLKDTKALQLSENVMNPTWESENRCAAVAEIEFEGNPVLLYSVHLASNGCKPSKYREKQTTALAGYVKKSGVKHVIGAGDFNVYKHSPCLKPIADNQDYLIKGELGATCSLAEEETLSWPVDLVFGKGFEPLFSTKLAYSKLSDHCLVISDLKLNEAI